MREANGDYPGALLAYDFAASIPTGTRAHYRAGVVHGKMATLLWNARQQEEAMGHFIEAKRRIGLARELPHGVTPEKRREFEDDLNRNLDYLKKAKVEPLLLPHK